ncbi:MAG: hypothetical protein JSW60_00075 [Thermoplasmatales archaeon]|nr:MAG: hypothetical protein JSW60_00075 [Thermoplasmatales archaeon]
MNKKIVGTFVVIILIAAAIPTAQTMETLNALEPGSEPVKQSWDNTITIFVNTSTIDARSDLNDTEKTALKKHILDHIKENFEGAVGEGNVTVTDDSSQQSGADRNVSIEPGMSDPPGEAWGQCQGGNNTVKVFLGEFMNDSSVNESFQNPDGSWNITKLGNAIGHTAGHELGHSYSVGHNHNERSAGFRYVIINPPNATDNRSKMTTGENINASERANIRFNFDNHTKDVVNNNLGKDACEAFPDYDENVLITKYWGPPSLPDKPDEAGSLDVLFLFLVEMSGWFELGFLGKDKDDGLYDGNPDFDFIYKTSLLNNEDLDAKILTFIDEYHDHMTWLLRGTEESPNPGEWFMLDPVNVVLEDFIDNPDGKEVARVVNMMWPEQGVNITFDALSFGELSNEFNGFIYGYVPTAPQIIGPESGEPGVEYSFTIMSTDPGGSDLFYYIEWGDGQIEDWIGPYPSGVNITVNHTWEETGTYTIRAKSRNLDETESKWSEDHKITIIPPARLEIGRIVGGFLGITAQINNTGTINATNVVGSMVLEGGFILIGQEISENLGTIEPGNISGVYNVPVLGFGLVKIIVSVSADEVEKITKTASGFVLLFYIIIH